MLRWRDRALLLAVLVVGCALGWAPTQCGPGNLLTSWGKTVNPQAVLPEYPRPQLVRANWTNLNGLWQFEPGAPGQQPPFGRNLNSSILVPFPAESCLSGVGQTYQYLWYRTIFSWQPSASHPVTVLHFGAVDWQASVWINQQYVGNHTGGYDGFSFDISAALRTGSNELIVFVYDPSDLGAQPNGKQRISAIVTPGGDTYTPSSGIWATVWLEPLPQQYIANLTILTDTRTLSVTVTTVPAGANVTLTIQDGGKLVAKLTGSDGQVIRYSLTSPKVWSPADPHLYDLSVSLPSSNDAVQSYFGLRSMTLGRVRYPGASDTGPQQSIDRPGGDMPGSPFSLPQANASLCWERCLATAGCTAWAYGVPNCGGGGASPLCWLKSSAPASAPDSCRVSGALATPPYEAARPMLNGGFLFLSGWLDQSFWPDGLYTAPTDDALLFDLQALQSFGFNTVRLHQKVNPERWYYHADRLGVIVLQDAVQKYGGATAATVPLFMEDMERMVLGRGNHPCIVQWELFNEMDCWQVFNVSAAVQTLRLLDPSRLLDTDSGGAANDFQLADVNDLHTYPYPGDPKPSPTQYGMLGEYGGLGAYVPGHEWVPAQCQSYLALNGTTAFADLYVQMAQSILSNGADISAAIYTQIADVERECDGFLNYDRTPKWDAADTQMVVAMNQALVRLIN